MFGSIVVSIPACHAGDRGSIPRRRVFWFCFDFDLETLARFSYCIVFSSRKKNGIFTIVFQIKAYARGKICSSNVIYFLNLEKKSYSNLFTEWKKNRRVKSYWILKFDIFQGYAVQILHRRWKVLCCCFHSRPEWKILCLFWLFKIKIKCVLVPQLSWKWSQKLI